MRFNRANKRVLAMDGEFSDKLVEIGESFAGMSRLDSRAGPAFGVTISLSSARGEKGGQTSVLPPNFCLRIRTQYASNLIANIDNVVA